MTKRDNVCPLRHSSYCPYVGGGPILLGSLLTRQLMRDIVSTHIAEYVKQSDAMYTQGTLLLRNDYDSLEDLVFTVRVQDEKSRKPAVVGKTVSS